MACTSIDGYRDAWDWEWWNSNEPREDFEKGTYDVEDMISKVKYDMDEKEEVIDKDDYEWKKVWKNTFPEKLYGKCFTFVPPSDVDKVTFYSPLGDLMNGPYLPNLKVIFHAENKSMNHVRLRVNLSNELTIVLGLEKRVFMGQARKC